MMPSLDAHAFAPRDAAARSEMSMGAVLQIVWRRRWFMAFWIILLVVPATIFIARLQPMFQATALVVLDTRQVRFADVSAPVSQLSSPMDSSFVRTEVAILASDSIARQVVTEMHLDQNPEFQGSPSLLSRLMAHLPALTQKPEAPPGPETILERTVASYRDRLTVFSDGRSYVISVGFAASDAKLAAAIANRHAEAYIARQRATKDQALASATSWLDREVASLSERVRQAERAIQDYREQHQLFVLNSSSGGNSVAQQQLTEALVELTRARSDLANREARLQEATDPNKSDSVPEVVNSLPLSRLREQQMTARQRVAELAGMAGAKNPYSTPMREELARIDRQIASVRSGILQGIRTEKVIAQNRVQELQRIVAGLEDRLAASERDGAGLRDLEREALATRSLYESLLNRQKQVATQVGIQQADAQLSSEAVAPLDPSFPKKKLFVAVALLVAGATGTVIALVLERRQSGFGTIEQTEAGIGLPVLAEVPRGKRSSLGLPNKVIAEPRSLEAEAVHRMRSILAMREAGFPAVLSVTSALPGEGKTSIALALGRSLARSGFRVLLVEADLRQGQLAGALFGGGVEFGTADVLERSVTLSQATIRDPATSLEILFAKGGADMPQDLLAPARLQPLIAVARAQYDHVIFDTPPFSAVADALVIGSAADETLVVVRAETTPAATVATMVKTLSAARIRIAGFVLNAVDPRRARLIRYPGQVSRLGHART